MDTPIIPQKKCTRCNEFFPATVEYFYTDRGNLTANCRTCMKKKSRQYELDNPEKTKAAHAKNYQKNKPKRDAKNKEWAKNHPEEKRAIERRYRENNGDKCNESNQRWLNRNPSKKREYTGRRRQRHTAAEGVYTNEDIQLLFKTQKGLCWWCGIKLTTKYEIDHRIPVSKGGSNWPNNLCLTCRKCNRSKSDKYPHEWSDRLL